MKFCVKAKGRAMTIDDIEERLERIRKLALDQDHEPAHVAEDELHHDVLWAIAENICDNPRACAAAALDTLNIRFERWHA